MGRPRKWGTTAERRSAQDDLRRITRANRPSRFICVDGEGFGREPHVYSLLGIGENSTTDTKGLEFGAIAEFLWEQYLEFPGAVFAGFFLGYDFTQWFKSLPPGRAGILLTPEGQAKRKRRVHSHLGPFPVQYDGWEFDILGNKRFRLRRAGVNGWLSVCDTGPFFQQSFLKVIDPVQWGSDPVCSETEYETIREGKARRDSAVLDSDAIGYNRLENVILSRVLERLDTGFRATGVRLKKDQWYGPGQAAQAWMRSTELPDREQLSAEIPAVRHEMARLTYYGGWFELFAHGHIPGNSLEYDINSAYPHVASQLPCLLHGTWTNGMGTPGKLGKRDIRIVHATVRGSNRFLGSMLHRTSAGTILRPSATRGWYWQSEIDSACKAGAIDSIVYEEWLQYYPCECPPPLERLSSLYAFRLSAGKNTAAGKAAKLMYNSMYGKLAQSIGEPRYANAFYASLITSGCREMILDAIATHPHGSDCLLMVATDGVYFRHPHGNLPISNRLGEWEEAIHENLTLFKPGVYWDDSARVRISEGASPNFKARGINAREFAGSIRGIDDHFSRWADTYPPERDPDGDREGWFPKVEFTSGFSMVTALQALRRGKWDLAGTISDARLVQDSDPISKRHSGVYVQGIYKSYPYPNGGIPERESEPGTISESHPYDKRFGQPDNEEYGINDDGSVMDEWTGMLYG
jgi:hypothetical protein